MKILGLDPAAKTGFAWSDGTALDFGTWPITAESDEHPGARLERLRARIYAVYRQRGIDRIGYEDAQLGSHVFAVQGMHAELRAIIKLAAKELGIECVPVNPASLKAFSTGNGRSKKDAMIRAAEREFGVSVGGDDNQADALMVLAFVRRPKLPEPDKVKRKRLAKVRKKEPRLF